MIVLIFCGETGAILAEMIAAKHYSANSAFLSVFFKMFLMIVFAAGFLIAGYMVGFKAFKNIWIVSIASITSILIMEPILAYAIFHQLPTKGALDGLILGVIGFLATIFYK